MCLRMKNNNTEIAGLIRSFKYALRGLRYAISNERNMRIHIVVALLLANFSYLYGLSANQFAILFLCFGLVMMAEMVNTAIEALVNLKAPAYDNLARIAKDVAAGAVFVCAVMTIIVAVFIFHDLTRLIDTILMIITKPLYLICFLLVTALGLYFIFGCCNGKTKSQAKKTDRMDSNK